MFPVMCRCYGCQVKPKIIHKKIEEQLDKRNGLINLKEDFVSVRLGQNFGALTDKTHSCEGRNTTFVKRIKISGVNRC